MIRRLALLARRIPSVQSRRRSLYIYRSFSLSSSEVKLLQTFDRATPQSILQILRELRDSSPSDAPQRAERWMLKLEQSKVPIVHEHYRTLFEIYQYSPNLVRARQFLHNYFDHFESPDILVVNAYLQIITSGKFQKQSPQRTRQLAQEAEALLDTVPPNATSYELVLRGHSRCRKSQRIFQDTWAVFDRMRSHLPPTERAFGILLDAAVCARHAPAVARITSLQQEAGYPLSTYNHNMMLLLCIKTRAPPERVEALFRSIEQPDADSYKLRMRGWKDSSHSQRGHRVAWILEQMWDIDDVSPTVQHYNTSLHTWESVGQPQEAERTLRDLQERGLTPTSESYTYVIRAWLRVAGQGSGSALQRADDWMRTLEDLEASSTTFHTNVDLYSKFLHTARRCPTHETVLLCQQVVDRVRVSRHWLEPVHFSRLLLVGLWAYSSPDHDAARTRFVRETVEAAKEAGLVSRMLFGVLANGPVFGSGWTVHQSLAAVTELFPVWPLPASYTRNIRRQDHLPQHGDERRRGEFGLSRHC